jgi:drug/metabolite transporter (DMT)-like permease
VKEEEKAQRRARLVGILLVNVATMTWATNITLGRWLRDDIGPLTLAAGRVLIASGLFALLLRQRPAEERRLGKDRWLLLGMALSGVVLFGPTLYLGLRYTTTVNTTLIQGVGPLITGLLATLLIREPMSRRQIGGAILGLLGVVTLISGGSLAYWKEASANVGDLIVLGAVALWALYSVVGRRVMRGRTSSSTVRGLSVRSTERGLSVRSTERSLSASDATASSQVRGRSAISATGISTMLGLPLLLAAAAWEVQVQPPRVSVLLLGLVVYIGIVPSVVGWLSWNESVRRLGSSGAMVFYNTLPLYGALLGIIFLGEDIGLTHVVGGALIIGGGIWASWGRQRPAPRSERTEVEPTSPDRAYGGD